MELFWWWLAYEENSEIFILVKAKVAVQKTRDFRFHPPLIQGGRRQQLHCLRTQLDFSISRIQLNKTPQRRSAGCVRGAQVKTKACEVVSGFSRGDGINHGMLSPRVGQLFLWWGGAALTFATFVRITRELLEGKVDAIDGEILLRVAKARTSWLTGAATDLTALGSSTLIVLFLVLALLVLILLRDRLGALQLVTASAGAGILTFVTMDIIERARPADAHRLIVASGFSYPSGHSVSTSALYLTIAIIGCRYVHRAGARAMVMVGALAVPVLVAASRVYLGIHYATDVASGLSLGSAWALLLAGFFTLRNHRPTEAPSGSISDRPRRTVRH